MDARIIRAPTPGSIFLARPPWRSYSGTQRATNHLHADKESLLRRGYYGTYHKMSAKHVHRYLAEFCGRHNIRDEDTIDQMRDWVAALIGKRLKYRDLVT